MKTAIATTVAVAAFCGSANADFINVKFTGTGSGQNARVTINGSTHDYFVGQLKHTLSAGTGAAAAMNGPVVTYCSDLFQSVTSSGKTYDVVGIDQLPGSNPMGAAKASAIRDIYTVAAGAQLALGASNALACAFQLAIWEIVTDYNGTAASLNVTSGSFKAKKTNNNSLDSSVTTQLNNLFAGVGHQSTQYSTLAGLRSGSAQDQIVAGSAVPTPGTLAAAGLIGLAGLRRRR
ncbi:MAG: hypothetical protein AABZ53_12650 [Planctomycetota bacterium]